MRVAELQIAPWEKILTAECQPADLAVYDDVIVKTDQGLDLAKVLDIYEAEAADAAVVIVRRATAEDWQGLMSAGDKTRAFQVCYDLIKQLGLGMKLVDVKSSFDASRLTFAFVASGRVDFRELVKELTHRFNKNIRLQQIGIRDEAKAMGDQGRCGRGLCCKNYLTKFSSVTSDVAEVQNLSGRGSDRLSGACGRLMCCLAYEAEGYKELAQELPALGSELNVKGKRGTVIGQHLLKKSLDVKFKGAKGETDYVTEVEWRK
jgi:cell fate regulator YaaT (PSP1 superfamily)